MSSGTAQASPSVSSSHPSGSTTRRGLPCRPRGTAIVIDPAPQLPVHDLVRDTAADLGLGLMRLQPDRHHLEDVFLQDPASAPEEVARG